MSDAWAVFESSWGKEIQAVDDPEIGYNLLDDDLEAVQAVLKEAIAGDKDALAALEEIEYQPDVFGTIDAALEVVTLGLEGTLTQEDIGRLDESRLYLSHDGERDA